MISNAGQSTQYRYQRPPSETDASAFYANHVKSEYMLYHRPTWAANKPSEHNAMNAPLTPGMIVWQARGQMQSKQTIRTLSRPVFLPGLGS